MRTLFIAIAAAITLSLGLLFFASVSLANYIDPVAFLIVGGGTVLVTVLRSGLAPFAQSLAVLCRRKVNGAARLDALASAFHEMALIARRDGPVALEHHKVDDPFLSDGLARFVDGADEERLRLYLERELARLEEHHAAQIDCWRGWIDHAPAMGLIGTIIVKGFKESKVTKVLLVRKGFKDLWVVGPVNKDQLVRKDRLVKLFMLVNKEQQVLKDFKVIKVLQDHKELLVLKGFRDQVLVVY